MISPAHAGPRLATRLAFVVAGFVSACWAPLIPFAKLRLSVNDAQLGALLLCFGVGSLVGVTASGLAAVRLGARPLVIGAGLVLSTLLPVLSVAATPLALGAALAVFGAAMGALDVAMNAHAVEVESAADKPLMSGFHALFSLGAFAGAGWMTAALRWGASPLAATGMAAVVGLVLVLLAAPRLLSVRPPPPERLFVLPTGLVAVIALLAATSFLAEGAVFDWSALLLVERRLAEAATAGAGLIVFSIAMTIGRLTGDAVVSRLGARRVLRWGGAMAAAGFALALVAPAEPLALAGFGLVGLGAANVVPVLFSTAGRQSAMPPALAVAAVTSTGYAGVLAGPPLIGIAAQGVGLPVALWGLVALVLLIPALAGVAAG